MIQAEVVLKLKNGKKLTFVAELADKLLEGITKASNAYRAICDKQGIRIEKIILRTNVRFCYTEIERYGLSRRGRQKVSHTGSVEDMDRTNIEGSSHRASENLSAVGHLAPWSGPAVLLLDLDAFFASVEQLDHPEWRGKPVIVGGDAQRRGVVSTCSYEARAFGVRSAMPSAQARRLCPNAIWTPGNFPRYIELSQQVMRIMTEASPHLQQVSIDEAFLDVSPGRFVGEHPVLIAHRIREQVAKLGITCSIGLGVSKSVAKVASDRDKPNGLTVVYPGSEAAFLAPLPIRVMSGVGHVAERRLHDYGIYTLGALGAADEDTLRSVFGKNAQMMRERCLGCDRSPVEADEKVKSVSNEMTFSSDLKKAAEIRRAVAMLAAKVGRRLRHKALRGHTVMLKLRFGDLSLRTAQQTLAEAVDNERVFTPVLHALIPQIWQPGESLRLVGVAVSGFDERPAQLSLFGDEAGAEELTGDVDRAGDGNRDGGQHATGARASHGRAQRSLVEATDRVRDRFGEDALSYGRELLFKDRGTGTIAQKKDDYKDPLASTVTSDEGTPPSLDEGTPPSFDEGTPPSLDEEAAVASDEGSMPTIRPTRSEY
jgi:DNA polymerase-4